MVDFHSHILPGIDDGAPDADVSLDMITSLTSQGVDTIVATPHFLPEVMSVNQFCENRKEAFDKVKLLAAEKSMVLPNIVMGAEVRLVPFLSKLENLSKLCIEGTNLILLEMPYVNWSDNWVFDEIFSISANRNLTPVIAHINRYIAKSDDYKTLRKLFAMEVYLQINIDLYPLENQFKRTVDKLIKNGHAHLIGSDCHNMNTRPPVVAQSMKMIEKKHGTAMKNTFNENALYLLNLQ